MRAERLPNGLQEDLETSTKEEEGSIALLILVPALDW